MLNGRKKADPITVDRAARYAKILPAGISSAMSKGHLMWKQLRGHRVTTRRWIDEWIEQRGDAIQEYPGANRK